MPDAPNPSAAPAGGPLLPGDDTAHGGGVFTAPERERLVAAFRAGNGTATEAELAAFVAWARGCASRAGC